MNLSRLALITSCSAMLVGLAASPVRSQQTTGSTPAAQATAKKIVNKTCPITGEEIDASTPTVSYKGHEVGFCCPGCDKKWLKQTDMEKDAFIAKFVTVAHEQPAKDAPTIAKDPAKTLAPINKICPISKEELDAKSPTVAYEGKTIAFCCKDCLKKFNAMDAEKKADLVAAILKATPANQDVIAAQAHHATLTGTLIDLACYVKGEKVDTSKESIACAESCVVTKGLPAGLLVPSKDGKGPAKLYILLNTGEHSAKDLYSGHFGQTASYCGDAFDKDGVNILFVDHQPDAAEAAHGAKSEHR